MRFLPRGREGRGLANYILSILLNLATNLLQYYMFIEIQNRIPESEPDLKIGPLSLWISGYTTVDQKEQGDWTYLQTPTLLNAGNIAIFSGMSDTPLFDLRKFLKDLIGMYEKINIDQTVELASCESEFHLKLTNNLGQIKIDIKYFSWSQNGSLEFEDRIDQSYLPKIIMDLKKILEKFTQY